MKSLKILFLIFSIFFVVNQVNASCATDNSKLDVYTSSNINIWYDSTPSIYIYEVWTCTLLDSLLISYNLWSWENASYVRTDFSSIIYKRFWGAVLGIVVNETNWIIQNHIFYNYNYRVFATASTYSYYAEVWNDIYFNFGTDNDWTSWDMELKISKINTDFAYNQTSWATFIILDTNLDFTTQKINIPINFTQATFFKRCTFLWNDIFTFTCVGANTDYYWSWITWNIIKLTNNTYIQWNTNSVIDLLSVNKLWIYWSWKLYEPDKDLSAFSSWSQIVNFMNSTGSYWIALSLWNTFVDYFEFILDEALINYPLISNDINFKDEIIFSCDIDKNNDVSIWEGIVCPMTFLKQVSNTVINWVKNWYQLIIKLKDLSPDLSFNLLIPQTNANDDVNNLMANLWEKSPYMFPQLETYRNIIVYWLIFIIIIMWSMFLIYKKE
jgi:hypothetical protein